MNNLKRLKKLEIERQLFIKEIQNCEACIASRENEVEKLNLLVQNLSGELENKNYLIKMKDKKIEELESSKKFLSAELKECEEYITEQVKEMKKLSEYVDSLGQDSQRKCIEVLETKVNLYKNKLAKEQENRKKLLEKIDDEKKSKEKVEEAFMRTAKIYEDLLKKNEDYETLLRKSEMYESQNEELNKIIENHKQKEEQMKKAMNEWAENLENAKTELENLSRERLCLSNRVEELESQVEEYENDYSLIDQNNKILLQTLEQEKAEKSKLEAALETLSKGDEDLKDKLQKARQSIKNITRKLEEYDIEKLETPENGKTAEVSNLRQLLYKKDKFFEDIRNELTTLNQQLDSEQLENVSAFGDAESTEQLKLYVRQLQMKNSNLNNELNRLNTYLKALLPGLNQMTLEIDKQKKEVENQKKMRLDTTFRIEKQLQEREHLCTRIRELMRENQELKSGKIKQTEPTVIFVEKNENNNKLRPLYGVSIKSRKDNETEDVKNVVKNISEKNKSAEVSEDKEKPTEAQKLEEIKSTEDAAGPVLNSENVKESTVEEEANEIPPKQQPVESLQDEATSVESNRDSFGKTAPPDEGSNESRRHTLDINEIGNLKEKLRRLSQENEDLLQNLVSALGQIETLKKSIGTEATSTTDLKEETKHSEKLKVSAATSMELVKAPSFSNERDELLRQIEVQKTEIAELLKKIEATTLENTLANDLEEKQNENAKLKNIINDLQNQLKVTPQLDLTLPEAPSHVEDALVQLRTTLASEQQRVAKLEECLKECENSCEKMKLINQELENENIKLKTKIEEEKSGNQLKFSPEYSDTMLEVNKIFSQVENDVNNSLNTIKSQIDAISSKILEMTDNSGLNDKTVQKLIEEIADLKTDLHDQILGKKKVIIADNFQEKHSQDLENQSTEWQQNYEEMKQHASHLEKVIEEMKKNVNFPDDVSSSRTELSKLQQKLEETERENANLQNEINRLHSEKELLIEDENNSDSKKRIEELEETVRKQKGEIELLKNNDLPIIKDQEEEISSNDLEEAKKIKEIEEILCHWKREHDNEMNKIRKHLEYVSNRPSTGRSDSGQDDVIKDLEDTLFATQNQYDSLVKKCIKLEAENERINGLLTNRDVVPTTLVYDSGVEKRIGELIEHVKNLEKENETLQTKSIKLDLDNKRLKNDLERIIGPDYTDFEKELDRLRDLERQLLQGKEKYQQLKRRLIKVEIDNRNLKKDYIDTLIAKEKMVLHNSEQEKRLRETNKLLKKSQDKISNLTHRIIKLQVENENFTEEMTNRPDDEVTERLQKYEDQAVELLKTNADLEFEIENLRWQLSKLGDSEDIPEKNEEYHSTKPISNINILKQKAIQLEVENEFMKRELEEMKGNILPFETVEENLNQHFKRLKDDDKNLHMKILELETENDFLKNELLNKENEHIEKGLIKSRITESQHKMRQVAESIDQLKMKNVELEIENEYLKKEIDRLTTLQEIANVETHDIDHNKTSHMLKQKIDSLEIENVNLKNQLASLEKEQITLETHTRERILRDVERLIGEYRFIKNSPLQIKPYTVQATGLEGLAERLKLWRQEYEPQIEELKNDLEKITKKSQHDPYNLEGRLRDCRTTVEKLEQDNKNFRIALEILLKDKPSLTNIKLATEVEHLLQKYQIEEDERKKNWVDVSRLEEVQNQLKEAQTTIDLLKNEKISLNLHQQDKKIRELEAQLRRNSLNPGVEVEKLESVIEDLHSQLAKLRTESQDLAAERASLKVKFEEQKKIIKEQTEEAEKFSKLYEARVLTIEDLERQLSDCKKQYGELQEKFQKDKKVSFSPSDEAVAFQKTETELEELRSKYFRLKKEHQEQNIQIKYLEEQLKRCRAANSYLKSQLSEFRTEGHDERRHEDDDAEEENKTNNSEEKGKNNENLQQEFEQLKIVEENLLKRQKSVENLTNHIGTLYSDHLRLSVYMTRVRELEGRLIQSHSNNRRMKIELERLRRGNLTIQYKNSQTNAEMLRKRLEESYRKNELLIGELERQKKELDSKCETELENNLFKKTINTLKQKLVSLEKDDQNVKEENEILQEEKEELMTRIAQQRIQIVVLENNIQNQLKIKNAEIKNLNASIDNLRNRLESLSTQKFNEEKRGNDALMKKLEKRNEEIKHLTFIIDDLKRQTEALLTDEESYNDRESTVLEKKNEEIRKLNETVEDLTRQIRDLREKKECGHDKLAEELQSKNGENQKLNLIISDLRSQIDHLRNLHLEEGRGDSDQQRVRKLEEILLKYRDNNYFLKSKIAQMENEKLDLKLKLAKFDENTDKPQKSQNNDQHVKKQLPQLQKNPREKGLDDLQKQVENCQASNDDLKQITVQLDSEIRFIKNEIVNILNEKVYQEKKSTSSVLKKSSNQKQANASGNEQKTKFVDDLRRQYKKDIDTLLKNAQSAISKMIPDLENLNRQPALIGIQQPVQHSIMPIMWQPPLLPFGQCPDADLANQRRADTEKDLERLNSLAERFQKTLDKSKRVLDNDVSKKTDDWEKSESDEETEERSFDFESCNITHSQTMKTESHASTSSGPTFIRNFKIENLNKKQQSTKERIYKLKNEINETMKQLSEQSQSCQTFTMGARASLDDRTRFGRSDFGRYQVINIERRHSSVSESPRRLTRCHINGPTVQKKNSKKGSHVTFKLPESDSFRDY